MKLKYFFPMLIAAAVTLFASCDEEDDATYLGSLRVSSSYMALPIEGGSATITISANQEWTVDTVGAFTGKEPWFDYRIIEEEDSLPKLTLTADATLDARNTSFKLRAANGEEQIINVMQGVATVSEATCADVIAGPDGKTYLVTGICTAIANTTYGNWYLEDGTGQLYIYGTLDANGATKNFESLGIEVGDEITVQGPKLTYGTVVELVDVTVININKSLIKVDSTEVDGVVGNELPLEGGELKAYVTCKGTGVTVDIPEDAKSWLSIASIKQSGTASEIIFKAALNEGGDRETTITFHTTDANGKDYTSQTSLSQKGSIVDASIADFNAAEVGTTLYRLSGVVTKISNAERGRFYIKDYSGETYIYNINDFESYGINVGDIVTVVGKRDQYNEVIEMTSGAIEDVKAVTEVSIPDFLAKDPNPNVYYMVTGTIKEIVNETYGNLYITDGTTDLYVYGCYPGYGATGDARKNFLSTANIEVGDKLTMIGYRYTHTDGTEQISGGIYFSHEKAAE